MIWQRQESKRKSRPGRLFHSPKLCRPIGWPLELVNDALTALQQALDVEYAVFFSGSTENDTVLKPKAISQGFPIRIADLQGLHFNWKRPD